MTLSHEHYAISDPGALFDLWEWEWMTAGGDGDGYMDALRVADAPTIRRLFLLAARLQGVA